MSRTVAEWVFNFVVLIFATSTIAQPFIIPTASMEGTLMVGDHLIVDKLAYSPAGTRLLPYAKVKRGDVVVFRFPPNIQETYVKRVIGVPGDRIHLVDGVVFRNGAALVEPYTQHIAPHHEVFPARGEITVPAGQYFAMGDNRDNSSDSRYWGYVPRENIIGKPLLVYWSYDAPTEDLTGFSVHHAVDLTAHFFTRTRWSRTLQFVRP